MGWYSTGPKIRTADLDIHALFTDYHPNPVFVIVDVQPENVGIPTLVRLHALPGVKLVTWTPHRLSSISVFDHAPY